MSQCETERPSGRRCLAAETREYIVGCVHEHVRRKFVCDACAEEAGNGISICLPCDEGPGAHHCRLLLQPAVTELIP